MSPMPLFLLGRRLWVGGDTSVGNVDLYPRALILASPIAPPSATLRDSGAIRRAAKGAI